MYDIVVLLIRGLLNHFMNMKVETPTALPHSSALTSISMDGCCGEDVSSTIISGGRGGHCQEKSSFWCCFPAVLHFLNPNF